MIDRELLQFIQQFSVCDYQLLSEKENPSHEVAKPQREDKVKGGFFRSLLRFLLQIIAVGADRGRPD
jgi:hypothetical protein